MNTEFHYFVNLLVAKLAGFSEQVAQIIATSSQFVDDNCKTRRVLLERTFYENIITQTLNINLPPDKLHSIYTCFHFQPGDETWVTKASSPLAQTIFTDAIASADPYMIGIASHAFADTYAHQNFIGHSHPYNNPIGISGVPNYGHMYYLELPDLIGIKWLDVRTGTIIDNNPRFIQAACDLLAHYCAHNQVGSRDSAHKKLRLVKLLKLIFKMNTGERLKQYPRIYREFGGSVIPPYGPQKWQRQAMYYSPKDAAWLGAHNFENSHWYHFQQQAKNYEALALRSIDQHVKKYKNPAT